MPVKDMTVKEMPVEYMPIEEMPVEDMPLSTCSGLGHVLVKDMVARTCPSWT